MSYTFDPEQPSALLFESPDPDVPLNVSQTVDFTLLKFPYDLSLSAYIDTGEWSVMVTCVCVGVCVCVRVCVRMCVCV